MMVLLKFSKIRIPKITRKWFFFHTKTNFLFSSFLGPICGSNIDMLHEPHSSQTASTTTATTLQLFARSWTRNLQSEKNSSATPSFGVPNRSQNGKTLKSDWPSIFPLFPRFYPKLQVTFGQSFHEKEKQTEEQLDFCFWRKFKYCGHWAWKIA